jgi:hypothetical protein
MRRNQESGSLRKGVHHLSRSTALALAYVMMIAKEDCIALLLMRAVIRSMQVPYHRTDTAKFPPSSPCSEVFHPSR